MNEAEFTQRVIDTAMLLGWRVTHFRPARTEKGYRTPVQGHKGTLDLILARRGVVLLAELKSDKGKPTPDQVKWLDAAGPHGRLWRPADWDRILFELRTLL
jgi:hypothetical protein